MADGSPLILVLVGSIMLSVLSIGLGTKPGAALRFLKHPVATARAIVVLFLAMPLLAILLATLLPLEPAGRTALLALALSPLPPLFSRKRAALDEDSIVGLQLVSAVVSVMAAPLLVLMIERALGLELDFEPGQIVAVLLATVAAPLLIGIAINKWFPAVATAAREPLGQAGLAILASSAVLLVIASWGSIRAAASPVGLLAVGLMLGLGLAIGHGLGGPEPERRRALAVATISRHPGVAVGLGVMAGTSVADAVLGTVLFYFMLSVLAGVFYLRVTRVR